MADDILNDEQLDEVETQISSWLMDELATNPIVAAVERGERSERRWYVRVLGESKDVFTIWFTLGQRTLQYETYVMPAPDENHAEFYEHLLRRNRRITGMSFCIGEEDAVFLAGSLPVHAINERELDRILGSVYHYVEQFFRPALRIGFASRFADD